MSRWYRAYAGTVKDDKLAEVSVIASCSRSVSIAVWHAILESAPIRERQEHGTLSETPRNETQRRCNVAGTLRNAPRDRSRYRYRNKRRCS